MRDCVRWSIQNKNKVPLLLLRKILYIQKPCLTLPARHGFWTKSNPFPYRPCRNWRNFSRKNSKKLWFYEVLSLFTQPNGFIVGTKSVILISSSIICFTVLFSRFSRLSICNQVILWITFTSCMCTIWCKWCMLLWLTSDFIREVLTFPIREHQDYIILLIFEV